MCLNKILKILLISNTHFLDFKFQDFRKSAQDLKTYVLNYAGMMEDWVGIDDLPAEEWSGANT